MSGTSDTRNKRDKRGETDARAHTQTGKDFPPEGGLLVIDVIMGGLIHRSTYLFKLLRRRRPAQRMKLFEGSAPLERR